MDEVHEVIQESRFGVEEYQELFLIVGDVGVIEAGDFLKSKIK